MSDAAQLSYIQGGQMHGALAGAPAGAGLMNSILEHGFQPGVMRPFIDPATKESLITVNEGGEQRTVLANAAATLRYDEWRHMDQVVMEIAKPRLKLINWLRGKNLVYNLPNAMGHPVLSTETISDMSEATISMDALASGENDRPIFDMDNTPIPIVSKQLQINARELAASRNKGTPLDTTKLSRATRRVVEATERLAVGSAGSYSYGGGTVYGLTNSPKRLTSTFTAPATGGWTPTTLYNQVLGWLETLVVNNHEGPFKVWYGTGLIGTMMQLFNQYDAVPLASKIAQIPNISGVEYLPYLTGSRIIVAEENVDVVRLIFGMDVTTMQWETNGGLTLNMMVMAIMVPQVRADQDNQTGILDAVPG
jgi:hypothetical protein